MPILGSVLVFYQFLEVVLHPLPHSLPYPMAFWNLSLKLSDFQETVDLTLFHAILIPELACHRCGLLQW